MRLSARRLPLDGELEHILEITKMAQGFQGFPVRTPLASSQIVLLSTITANASSTVDVEFTQSIEYSEYIVVAAGVSVGTNGDSILCRVKQSGAYLTGTSYAYNVDRTATTTAANTLVSIVGTGVASVVIADNIASDSATNVDFELKFMRNLSTTAYTHKFTLNGVESSGSGVAKKINGLGTYIFQGTTQGFRFFASTGTISGTFKLYGLKS